MGGFAAWLFGLAAEQPREYRRLLRIRKRVYREVAPLEADPDEAFARLATVAADLRSRHPAATMISAGMSGDFASAIRHGATHLRVGTALLGRRSTHVG